MNQLEMNETELMALALKQLIAQGKFPAGSVVRPYRCGTADDDGQYTFIFRWEEDEEDRG